MSFSPSMPAGAQGAAPGFMRSIGAALTRAWVAYLEYRLHRLLSAHLHAMSDRDLKDIGLTRSEIDAAIRGPDPLTPYHLRGRHF